MFRVSRMRAPESPSSPRSPRPRVAVGARLRRSAERRRRRRGGERSRSRGSRASHSSPPATAPASAATRWSSRSRSKTSSLAPRHFGGEPQLGEGNIRFSLNRVPDCVDPEKLQHAIKARSATAACIGRLVRLPAVRRARTASSPSGSAPPAATRPRPGRRSTTTTCRPASTAWSSTSPRTTARRPPFHDVTNFQILQQARAPRPKPCPKGKVSSAKAAACFE